MTKHNPKISYSIKECRDIIKGIINGDIKITTNYTDDSIKLIIGKLLEYVLTTSHSKEVDEITTLLLAFIAKSKSKNKKAHETEQDSLLKTSIENQMRFIIYEIYKIVNPQRIAGETHVENFINNIVIRGIEAAIFYDRHNIAKAFSAKELAEYNKITSGFANIIKTSNKSFGRGW